MKTIVFYFLFTLVLYLAVVAFPGAQAPAWAATENRAILLVGNMDDETSMQSVAAVRNKLKELKAEGKIKYKLLAYDYSVGEQRKYLEQLGVFASTLPLVAIVELYPDDTPKTILWRTSARSPSRAVTALLAEMVAGAGKKEMPSTFDNEEKTSLARSYIEKGDIIQEKKDYDRAIAEYTKAISLKPEYAIAYFDRGNSYFFKKEYDHTIADCSKAISLVPTHAPFYLLRGMAYENKNEKNLALADFRKTLTLADPMGSYFKKANEEIQKLEKQ
jgi:tetratricopeptide (TPR) repeat protein